MLTLDNGLPRHLVVIAALVVAALAICLLRRMPPGDALRPALRPALALAAAWLFAWPYQLPWYDAIFICALVLYPASRLDWLVILRLTAATIANTPGIPAGPPGHVLRVIDQLAVNHVAPLALLAALLLLAWLAVTGRWGLRCPPPLSPPPADIPPAPSRAALPALGAGTRE